MDRYHVDHGEFEFAEQPRQRRGRRAWRMFRRLVGVALLALVVAALIYHARIVAQYRAAVILGTTTNAPGLARAARWVTHTPSVSDTTIAGTPVTIARPAGSGPWPTMIFITGADPKGRHEAHVSRLARGLARAGIVAVVPDLPGLADARVTPDTLDAGTSLVAAVAKRASTKDGKVSIASVSTGASLALLIAERPASAQRIQSVAAIAPFADIRNALLLMTTGKYRRRDGSFVAYPTDPYLKRAITQSLLAEVNNPPQQLVDAANDIGSDAKDPFAPLRAFPLQAVDPDARALLALLTNRDPAKFDALYDQLPDQVRSAIEALSPIAHAKALRGVHVEIATSTHDRYFPADESRSLARALPDATLTVTNALDHAIPKLSRDSIGDMLALDGFLVRAVRHATN